VAKADTKITFNVNDEFLLWGTIQELKLSIIDFQPYYKTATTIDVINAKLTLVTPLMEAYANSLLDNGWKLPLPRNITKYILRQKVEARDGYLLIDGDADFTKLHSILKSSVLRTRVARNLESMLPDSANMTDNEKRFYGLIEKVYLLKLRNGDLN
jgi:hypothetical protein